MANGPNEIFEGPQGKLVLAQTSEVPYNEGGIGYSFYLIDLAAGTNKQMNKEEVKAFYKELKDRSQRISLWYCMKDAGWVGKRHEEDLYENDHVYGRRANF